MSAQPSREEVKVAGGVDIVSKFVFLAVSTALVFVVTRLAAIQISAFNGQEFDFGDIMVFIFAWTFGPGVGAFAGGLGSAISDASIPSPFAPFTLVIKGTEGFLAGYVAKRNFSWSLRLSWIFASSVMVGGYFMTNWLGLGYGLLAGLYEVPFDIMQVVAGGIIARPVSQYLRASLPTILPTGRARTRQDDREQR